MSNRQSPPAELAQFVEDVMYAVAYSTPAHVKQLLSQPQAKDAVQYRCCIVETRGGVTSRWGNLHAFAVAQFFGGVSQSVGERTSEELEAARKKMRSALEMCSVFIEAGVPVSAHVAVTAPDDLDSTFVAQRFVVRDWNAAAIDFIEDAFGRYVHAGIIRFEEPLHVADTLIGGRLPVDAAIKVGNGHSAAAHILAGARYEHIATDGLGRPMDLVEYVHQTAAMRKGETAALVIAATMQRTIGLSQSQSTPSLPRGKAPRRHQGV